LLDRRGAVAGGRRDPSRQQRRRHREHLSRGVQHADRRVRRDLPRGLQEQRLLGARARDVLLAGERRAARAVPDRGRQLQ
jgi:hypothetical protein